ETACFFQRFECSVEFQFPRDELGRVWTPARVMIAKPLSKVARMASVNFSGVTEALEDVRVKHETGLPSFALNPRAGSERRMVEPRGFEPLTPTMPLWCSTN